MLPGGTSQTQSYQFGRNILLAKDSQNKRLKTLTMIFWKVHPPSCFIPHNTNLRRLEIFFLHSKADENY